METKEKEIGMISAVNEALKFRKENPYSTSEEILQHVSKFIRTEKNEDAKLGMIAASSKALKILEKNDSLRDKEVIREVMKDMPELTKNLS